MLKQATFYQFHSIFRKAKHQIPKLKITCSNTCLENRTRDNPTTQTYESMMVGTLETLTYQECNSLRIHAKYH